LIGVLFLSYTGYKKDKRIIDVEKDKSLALKDLQDERKRFHAEIFDKLNKLAQTEKEQGMILSETIQQFLEKTESQKNEDILNLVDFKLSKFQARIEDLLDQRSMLIQKRISEFEERLEDLEAQLQKR
jgi:hypothetical protein